MTAPTERVYGWVKDGVGLLRPGALVKFDRKAKVPDEARYEMGTLWVWGRDIEEHYLMQTSCWKHHHRVQAVFWHPTIAQCVRSLIVGEGVPKIAVYTMLREAGIIPLPEWKPRAGRLAQ